MTTTDKLTFLGNLQAALRSTAAMVIHYKMHAPDGPMHDVASFDSVAAADIWLEQMATVYGARFQVFAQVCRS